MGGVSQRLEHNDLRMARAELAGSQEPLGTIGSTDPDTSVARGPGLEP